MAFLAELGALTDELVTLVTSTSRTVSWTLSSSRRLALFASAEWLTFKSPGLKYLPLLLLTQSRKLAIRKTC